MSDDTRARSSSEALAERVSRRSLGIVAFAVPAVVFVDQLSKWLAWNRWGPAGDLVESQYLGGLVRLHFVRNTGSAFGLFQGQSSLLTVAGVVAIGFLAIFFIRNARENPHAAAALGLLVGGAIGNLIDRIRLGYVVDWIKLPVTLSFNVADAAIAAGMAMMFAAILFQGAKRPDDPVAPACPESTAGAAPLTHGNED